MPLSGKQQQQQQQIILFYNSKDAKQPLPVWVGHFYDGKQYIYIYIYKDDIQYLSNVYCGRIYHKISTVVHRHL